MDDIGLVDLVQQITQRQVQVVGRLDMEAEHGLQVLQAIVEPQRGIVDDRAQPIVVLLQVVDQRLAVGRQAKVGLELHDVRVRRLGLDAAAGTDHGMAGLCQLKGQGQPDALAGSGNENWAVHVRAVNLSFLSLPPSIPELFPSCMAWPQRLRSAAPEEGEA
ncbi:hypothetical protein D3C81_1545060 [compost metagenome]